MELRYDRNFFEYEVEYLFERAHEHYDFDVYRAIMNSAHIITAWQDGKLIGLIRSIDDNYWKAHIDCIVVSNEYTQTGLASILIESLMYEIRYVKYVTAIPSEKYLIPLYKAFHFKEAYGCLMRENRKWT